MNPSMRKALWVFGGSVLAGMLIAGIIVWQLVSYTTDPGGRAKGQVDLIIPKGSTGRKVSELLAKAQLIDSPGLFRFYATQRKAARRFRPGNYRIKPRSARKSSSTFCWQGSKTN